MSQHDNMNALEKQLADLQLIKDPNNPAKVKKIPPAVPPKKKAQPQVPHSAAVITLREPSYSSKIRPVTNNNTTYSNTQPNNARHVHKDYANVTQLNLPSLQHYQRDVVPPISSNTTIYRTTDNLPSVTPPPPPPLPPPPPSIGIASARPYNVNLSEDFLPPPSPVSSNYSELVRATTNINYNQERQTYPPIYQNEFPNYGISQTSNYESLYEPINPSPHSNTSPKTNAIQNYNSNLTTTSKKPLQKEEEVDALTNLLVQSISDSQDLDIFGTCVKCNGKVIGENSGCTAMGNMYHVHCFRCDHCNVNLQGKAFYAVEGQPYCEADYYETLEKCSVCNNPILDRILRATGKPYHPNCFMCVVCGKSLDGIPFTVDAMNQIHCIEDFHKKFAPRCCVCELPIMPEEGQEETVRVVALDRSFHVRCYRCEDCGLLLSSEAEGRGCYPLDDHILCRNCNAHRIRLITNVMTTDL